ncbi:hypothetical protein VUR80DRAFT_10025 [Thermomyces stellatus]
MEAYSSTVVLSAEPRDMPQDGADKIHHVVKNGRLTGFKNPYPSWGEGNALAEMIRLVAWPSITGELKAPDTTRSTVAVHKPEFLASRTASDKIRATWLGHACYYVEFPSGLRVLFDPVFEDRCSPFSFLGPKRYTQPPCDISDLPTVDAVFISHSHYDHLSRNSVLDVQRNHPRAHFFVPKGLEAWFKRRGLRNVTELDWWEDAELTLTLDPVGTKTSAPREITARISCTPSQHTSARGIFDRDTTLWCSWGVYTGGRSVWFGGDTGYRRVPRIPESVDDYGPEYESLPRCPQFKQIGELRGPFDLGLIPIGAYYPRHPFSRMHSNPFDAVEIFSDTRCNRAMGIHWGTWALTMEEVFEPPMLLKAALKRKGLPETGTFDVCDIGESREF